MLSSINNYKLCNESIPDIALTGPSDVGGACPPPTYKYWDQCCCSNGCCWENCRSNAPPVACLSGVLGAKWIYNSKLGYYQAVLVNGK